MNLCVLIVALGAIEISSNWKIVAEEDFRANVTTVDTERYWTEISKNDILFTKNQSEPSQNITFYKRMDKDLLFEIIAVVRDPTGHIEFTSKVGEPVNMCKKATNDPWRKLVSDLYENALLPDTGCPTQPGTYKIYRKIKPLHGLFIVWPRCGKYTVQSWVRTGGPKSIMHLGFTFYIKKQCI